MKKVAILMLLLFSLESIAQNVHERQLKYWYLRDRLRYFIVPSDDPLNDKGTYLVITSRNRNWEENEGFTDIADYGQENRLFGKYLGVLATEFYLLSYYGHNEEAQRTNDELLNALEAVKRIDLCEEQYDPSLSNTYDGFFIRHDVPEDDGVNPPTNSFILQSDINTYAGLLIGNDLLIDNDQLRQVTHINGYTPFNEEMSQDEAIFLLEGLTLAYKFGSNEVKTIAKARAKKVLWRMWGYTNTINHKNWLIYGPYPWTIVTAGSDCNSFSYAIQKIGKDFFGFSEPMPPNPLSYNEWLLMFNGGQNSINSHMIASLAAMSKVWGNLFHKTQYGIFNNTDQEGWDYYYLWLYKALWDDSWCLYNVDRIEDRLDEAPCEGPWLSSIDDHAQNGWASPEKWSYTLEQQLGDSPGNVGIYSGIDYLILFNLYFINNVLGSAPYEDYANAISNRNWPDGDLGTSANPFRLEVFRSIVSEDVLSNQPTPANIFYQAGEKIVLQPRFKAESGTHFLATINALNYCVNPPADMLHTLYQYPPVPKYNGTELSSYQVLNEINKVSSISSNKIQEDIIVFPNPSRGVFYIDNVIGYDRYEIRNTFGAIVSSAGINNTNFKINLSGFEGGFYYIVFTSDENCTIRKLLLE